MRIVLMGEIASGKDYIRNYLINNYGFKKIVTHTTRPMRDGEVDGETYHFLSEKEFFKKREQGFFLEVQEYHTKYGVWYYGTSKESCLEDNTVIILDKDGWIEYSNIAKNYSIYLSTPQKEERFYRALTREKNITKETVEEVYRRINTDREKFQDIYDMVDFVVPQFYDEDTLNVLDHVMKRLGVDKR